MQKGQKLPPVQRHKLTIDLSDDTLEALRELKDGFVLGKGLEGGGTALQGLLGNPTLALAGVAGVLGAILGAQHVETIVDFFRDIQAMFDATTNETKQEAAGSLIDSMRALIQLFSPLGAFTPLPEGEPREPFIVTPLTPEECVARGEELRRNFGLSEEQVQRAVAECIAANTEGGG